jgi:hypothetical protein
MQEFSNFENFQFVKNTKFSQNLNFYYRDLRPKKKLLQFAQEITKKKLSLELENPWFRIGKWLDFFANIYPKLIWPSWRKISYTNLSLHLAFGIRLRLIKWTLYIYRFFICGYLHLKKFFRGHKNSLPIYFWNLIKNEWLKYVQNQVIRIFYSFFTEIMPKTTQNMQLNKLIL